MKYQIGDIVLASEAVKTENVESVKNRFFVVISDDEKIVPMEYFGFVISSRIDKSKNNNSKFPYNEMLYKSNINNLDRDSIVKCDQLFDIPANNIYHSIGKVKDEEMNIFLDAYESYLNKEII